jgi:hypothetical protein
VIVATYTKIFFDNKKEEEAIGYEKAMLGEEVNCFLICMTKINYTSAIMFRIDTERIRIQHLLSAL